MITEVKIEIEIFCGTHALILFASDLELLMRIGFLGNHDRNITCCELRPFACSRRKCEHRHNVFPLQRHKYHGNGLGFVDRALVKSHS